MLFIVHVMAEQSGCFTLIPRLLDNAQLLCCPRISKLH